MKLRSFLGIFFYTAIFFGGLEIVAFFASQQRLFILFGVLFVLLAVSIYGVQRVGTRLLYFPVPIMLTLSAVALFYFIDITAQQQIFIILSTFIYGCIFFGITLMRRDFHHPVGRGFYVLATMVVLFLAYTAIYGIYLNFFIPLWVLMIAYALLTHSLGYPYFYIVSDDKKRSILYSTIISLSMAELVWAMNFWPIGYLTTGVISLMFYYMLWDLAQSMFLEILSKKRIIANILFFVIVISALLFIVRDQFTIIKV